MPRTRRTARVGEAAGSLEGGRTMVVVVVDVQKALWHAYGLAQQRGGGAIWRGKWEYMDTARILDEHPSPPSPRPCSPLGGTLRPSPRPGVPGDVMLSPLPYPSRRLESALTKRFSLVSFSRILTQQQQLFASVLWTRIRPCLFRPMDGARGEAGCCEAGESGVRGPHRDAARHSSAHLHSRTHRRVGVSLLGGPNCTCIGFVSSEHRRTAHYISCSIFTW
ncbi:hypothetical protein BD413DRAFT_285310 [Trametes elegans]|nr:hypothetical protein BD413DRAFT_285310 [Trametes elegans]